MTLSCSKNFTLLKKQNEYRVSFDKFRIYLDSDLYMDLAPLSMKISFADEKKERFLISVDIPGTIPVFENGVDCCKFVYESRNMEMQWERKLGILRKIEISLKNLSFLEGGATKPLATVRSVQLHYNLTGRGDSSWNQDFTLKLSDIGGSDGSEELKIGSIALVQKGSGDDFAAAAGLERKIVGLSLSVNSAKMQPAKIKELFGDIDKYIGQFGKVEESFTISDLQLHDKLQSFRTGLLKIVSEGRKDPKSGNLSSTFAIETGDIDYVQKMAPNLPAAMRHFHLDESVFSIDGRMSALPPTLFSGLARLVDMIGPDGKPLPKEKKAFAEGILAFTGKLLDSIRGVSTDISFKGLSMEAGGRTIVSIPLLQSSVGYASNDKGIGTLYFKGSAKNDSVSTADIPRKLQFDFKLDPITPFSTLLPEAERLVDMHERKKFAAYMNARLQKWADPIYLKIDKTFIAFSDSLLSVEAVVKPDNASVFGVKGSMNLLIENPDALKKILLSDIPDEDLKKALDFETLLADRRIEGGRVTDRIDANVTADGRIIVNKKDVTDLFLSD